MKVFNLILLIIILSFVASILTFILYQEVYIEKIVEYNVSVKVADRVAVNVDAGKLYFGKLFPYSNAERHLILNNDLPYPVRVVFISSGETKDWLSFAKNNFVMLPGQDDKISVIAEAKTSEYGNYTGKVKVIFKKVFFFKEDEETN